MYGLFYLTKDSKNHVILLFQSEAPHATTFKTRVLNWSGVKKFDQNVVSQMRESVETHFDKPYRIFYAQVQDMKELKKLTKELSLRHEDLSRPLVRVDRLDLDIQNLVNVAPREYPKEELKKWGIK